ncbi:MAG: hypothetical protein M1840_005253 [Geoglossum simile]|nr:MAG: hypothetical protein M1840_005253 [Geoglossum simile]
MLLRSGADADEKEPDSRPTALAAAAMGRHLSVVKGLLAAGSDVDLCYFDEGDEWSNALCAAVLGGSCAVVKRLLKAGAEVDPDLSTKTPLTEAALNGNARVVKILLEAGADVNRKNGFGEAAVGCAVSADDVETARILLAGGADINTLCTPSFLESGLEDYLRRSYECTPLARAVHSENEEMVDLFLQHGADIRITSSDGLAPVDDAREMGYKSIERKLREHQEFISKSLAQTQKTQHRLLEK